MKHHAKCIAVLTVVSGMLAGGADAKDWNKLVIATEGSFPPFNMQTSEGGLAGFDIDLGNEICRRAKLECQFVLQDWNGVIPALQLGKFDAILSGMSVTPQREEVISFSVPYVYEQSTFAILKGNSLADLPSKGERIVIESAGGTSTAVKTLIPLLSGKSIGVQAGSSQEAFLKAAFADASDVTIKSYKTNDEQDPDLQAGRVDTEFASTTFLKVAQEKSPDLELVGPILSGGPLGSGIAIGLRKADPELKDILDQAITQASADGTLAALSMKWFKVDISKAK